MRQKLGQHFLNSREKLDAIANAVHIKENDTIIEIGPGHGELTSFLVDKVRNLKHARLFLLERDAMLIPGIKQN
ncbi:MAG: rRNA adenine N-6-methyltransferase family protein [Patescibacteria group bacterium]